MTVLKTIKIFLASSSELKEDREQFEIFINRKNKQYTKQDIFLELVLWEDFLDAMSPTRLQDEYNKAITDSDVFVSLFKTKVGQYTEEEFTKAYSTFQANKRPLIYTYFKNSPINLSNITPEINSLINFKAKLDQLGHFYTQYNNIEDLKYKFSEQLIKLIPELTNIQLKKKPTSSQFKKTAGEREVIDDKNQRAQESRGYKEIKLKSAKGVDYTRLRDLLAAQKWLEADQENIKVMLKATEKKDSLSSVDIKKLPCEDLDIIAQLWQTYSLGRFGFLIQAHLYQQERKDYYNFCTRVGWRVGDRWIGYNDLNWTLNALPGHLPHLQGRMLYPTEGRMTDFHLNSWALELGDKFYGVGESFGWKGKPLISAIAQRLTECGIL